MEELVSLTKVEEDRELSWKTESGKLIPISKLSLEEIHKAKKLAINRVNKYYQNYEFFTKLLESIDKRLDKMEDELYSEYEYVKRIKEES